MAVKFAEEIVREIKDRETIFVPEDCITGEAFEVWLTEQSENMTAESPV